MTTEFQNVTPRFAPEGGWAYTPTALAGQSLMKESARQHLKHQASSLLRPSPAHFRDPVAVALFYDALARMEHDHRLTSTTLVPTMTTEYPQFTWTNRILGRMMNDLAAAAEVAPLNSPPVEARMYNNRVNLVVHTDPQSWRWLLSLRNKMGTLAERALEAAKVQDPTTTYWPDYPWALARTF